MRQELKNLGNQRRYTFQATFVRTGFKDASSYRMLDAHYKPTLLVKDVCCNGQLLTDHLWMNYGKQFQRLGRLHPGDPLQFDGRVSVYYKGYHGFEERDYKIERPTHVQRSKPLMRTQAAVPDDNQALIGMIMLENQAFYRAQGRPYDDFYVDQYRTWQQKKNALTALSGALKLIISLRKDHQVTHAGNGA